MLQFQRPIYGPRPPNANHQIMCTSNHVYIKPCVHQNADHQSNKYIAIHTDDQQTSWTSVNHQIQTISAPNVDHRHTHAPSRHWNSNVISCFSMQIRSWSYAYTGCSYDNSGRMAGAVSMIMSSLAFARSLEFESGYREP